MTRPKVDPEKRQRTANACDSCKRRKQKCDGNQPCNTCTRKSFTCVYSTTDQKHGDRSSPEAYASKRIRNNEGSLAEAKPASQTSTTTPAHGVSPRPPVSDAFPLGSAASMATPIGLAQNGRPEIRISSEQGSTSAGEEEVDNHTMTRMLEDGAGRLVYIGDSATLSFLQLLRMIVETVAGPTPFTMDPARHAMTETQLSLPPNVQLTHQLPAEEITHILVDAFFVHTHGLLQIFDESKFLATLVRVYSDPLTVDYIYMCHLNLVLAIGFCVATPELGSREAAIIDDLRSKHSNQSEVFYFNAKSLSDPIASLEDGDTWSIQALLLMAAYMMYRSKRNAAYSFVGMAVRTAYSLGMHSEETLIIFPVEEQESRKRLWRSLFIMDRLLAAYLGRPVAIAEEECCGALLNPRVNTFQGMSQIGHDQIGAAGLEATVRSAHVIGLILRKVYRQRRISTKLAQELAEECKQWPEKLSPALHWRRATSENPRQALAILHANLAYCHSIILLSRPFFLYLLSAEVQQMHLGGGQQAPLRPRVRMQKFSNACIIASKHTVALVQNAYEGRYLTKLNCPVTYTLLEAALVIFADEFVRPSTDALSSQCMANAISILSFCGEMDPQARRAAHVLTEFHDVLRQRGHPTAFLLPSSNLRAPLSAPKVAPNTNDKNTFMPTIERSFTPIPPLPGASSLPTPGLTATGMNDFSPSVSNPPIFSIEDSFSGLLDLTNTVLPTMSDLESTGTDEAIDFDALWGWPDNTVSSNFGVPSDGLR